MARGPLLLLLVAAALAGGACGSSSSGGGETTSGAPPQALLTPRWVLVPGALGITDAEQVVGWLDFAPGGSVTGEDGCNRLTGTYTAAPGDLRFGPLAGTRRACVGAADAVAREVTARLPRVRHYAIDGRTLALRDASGTTLLEYTGTTPGVGGAWEATSVLYDDAIRGVIETHRPTADFAPGGRISGTTGCNEYTGTYETGGGRRITIRPGAVTERACADPEANRQERGFLDALRSVVRFDQTGPGLTLYDAQGRMAMTLQRAG